MYYVMCVPESRQILTTKDVTNEIIIIWAYVEVVCYIHVYRYHDLYIYIHVFMCANV